MAGLGYDWNWNKERNKKRHYVEESKTIFKGLNLTVSDPGKLFTLLASLWDERCPPIESKINKYLMSVTGADLTFFMHSPLSESDLQIQVLGDVELETPFSLQAGSEFSRRVLKARGPIFTDDLRSKDQSFAAILEKQLKKVGKSPLENILILPINTSDSENPSCFYGVVNSSITIGGLDRNRSLINECLRYCIALVVSTYASDMEKLHSDMCGNVIKSALLAFTNIDSEKELARVLQDHTAEIMSASLAKVYFFEEEREKGFATVLELVPPPTKKGTVTLEETKLRSFISTPEIIINKDPKEAFQFTQILNKNCKTRIRTLMSFPTFYNGNANGHIEVMNKKVRGGFHKKDEEYARCLGAIDGLAIEAMWKLRDARIVNQLLDTVDCVLMRRAEINCTGVRDVLQCTTSSHSYDYLLEFNFNPYDVPENHVACVLMGIFDELDLIQKIRLNDSSLIRFFMSTCRAYGNLPYHNWYHGFATAHFVFVLINSLSLLKQGTFTGLECFALLIAALAHDVDFRGCTSTFQLTAGDNLGALYSSTGSVQQLLSLTTTLQMITHPHCNLLSRMDLNEFRTFVNILKMLILGMDLSSTVDKVSDLYIMTYRKFDRDSIADVSMLLSLCLTCADLSDYTTSWQNFMMAHDRQMQEFYRAGERNVEGVFDVEDLVFNSHVQVKLQVDFMKCFVLPIFENLYIIFPTTYECYNRAEQNLAILDDLSSSLQKYPESSISDLYRLK